MHKPRQKFKTIHRLVITKQGTASITRTKHFQSQLQTPRSVTGLARWLRALCTIHFIRKYKEMHLSKDEIVFQIIVSNQSRKRTKNQANTSKLTTSCNKKLSP
jgi:ribosomal protein L31E